MLVCSNLGIPLFAILLSQVSLLSYSQLQAELVCTPITSCSCFSLRAASITHYSLCMQMPCAHDLIMRCLTLFYGFEDGFTQ